jgi:hypothetical protein
LVALAVYAATLLPSTGWGDIARFQYVAQIWGIPHRFGYPLYIALSRLFGYLPVGTLAYRANLMSAVFAALAAVMVYLIVMRLVADRIAAAAAALSLAFSQELWTQAIVAEVYALNAFLIGAVVLTLLVWHQTRRKGWLYLGIGIYALSFGNHMTVVMLVPAVLFLILVTNYRVLLDLKTVAVLAGLVLLGAMQYLYVIFRAQQQPLLNELGPFSWRGWIHWMTRSRFPGQFFGFSLADQVDRLRIYLELLEQQFFRWGYILGWIGIWEQLKAGLTSAGFLALVALGVYAFGMNYGGGTFPIYLIPTYLIFAVFLGCGLSAVRRWGGAGLRGAGGRVGARDTRRAPVPVGGPAGDGGRGGSDFGHALVPVAHELDRGRPKRQPLLRSDGPALCGTGRPGVCFGRVGTVLRRSGSNLVHRLGRKWLAQRRVGTARGYQPLAGTAPGLCLGRRCGLSH